ncbi:MAG: hypothetical protein DYG89_14715 [Caldilinea sp. CFX5]|nr:hypothetical protein [Caldilinea sp. CFX5]
MAWTIIDENHRQIIQELEAQTDRGAAIIGASLIDKQLEEAIRVRLLCNSATKELFKLSGPMHSFSAKINLAFALGLYGSHVYNDLNLIRKIRNDFAHFEIPINFTTQSISNRCSELWLPKHVEINHQPLSPKEPRDQYLRAVNILNSMLWKGIQRNYTKINDLSGDFP